MSRNENITLPQEDVTPEKALTNIRESKKKDLPPDIYAEMDKVLGKDPEDLNVDVPTPVARSIAKSEQHAQVIKEDISQFGTIQKQLEYAKLVFDGKSLDDEKSTLSYRKAVGETLNDEEDFRLNDLRFQSNELQKAKAEYDYNFAQSLPAEVAGIGYDVYDTLRDHYQLILGFAGVGAGTGAALGALTVNPVGVGAGALALGVKGAGVGTMAAFAKHTYIQTTGSVYEELSISPEAIDLPEQTKRDISKGAGILSGALMYVLPGSKYVKNTAFLKKMLNPSLIVKNPKIRSVLMKLAGSSAAAEGTEEAAQELTEVIAVNLGKTWDGTETSFLDAVERSWSMDTAERVAKAGTLGAIGGQVMQSGLDVATAIPNKILDSRIKKEQAKTPDLPQGEPGQFRTNVKGNKAVQLKVALDQHLETTKDTKTGVMLPEEMDAIRQEMFDDIGVSEVYIDPDEITAWANDDERAAKARELIGVEGVAAAEMNAPIRIQMYKFLRIAEEHPEITKLIKAEPDKKSVMQYLLELDEAKQQRDVVLGEIGAASGTTEVSGLTAPELQSRINTLEGEKLNLKKTNPNRTIEIDNEVALLTGVRDKIEDVALREKRIRDDDITDEETYLEQQTFTKDMEDILPAKEILNFNEAETIARAEVADAVLNTVETEQVVDLEERYRAERAEQIAKLDKEAKTPIVDSFLDSDRSNAELTPDQEKRKRKGLPIHSINPELLSERLKTKYEDDPVLKARNVFVKNGMKPEDVAVLYEEKSVESLLETLSKTSTTAEIVAENDALIEAHLEETVDFSDDVEFEAMGKAYDNVSKLHLESAKIIRDKHWAKFKKGMKRVVLDISRLNAQLQKKAADQINSTKIGQLNARQWSTAARRSQRKAAEAYLDGKFEEGFRQKQNAAEAVQLVKETKIATGRINKIYKRIAKFNNAKYKAELSEAGDTYVNAMNYFTDLFNFDPSTKGQQRVDQYSSYLQERRKRGELDEPIPPEVLEWLNTKVSPKDMTVGDLNYVASKMGEIVHQARLHNKLQTKEDQRTTDVIGESAYETASNSVDWDPKRLKEKTVTSIKSNWDKIKGIGDNLENYINNNFFILRDADGDIPGGFFRTILHDPIAGVGQFEGLTGLSAASKVRGVYRKRYNNLIKKHYGSLKTFRHFGVEKIVVPELEHMSHKGKFTRPELMIMLANISSNKNYVENFGVDPDVMMTILKKYLSKRDFDFVQEGMWDTFKTLGPKIVALHKKRTGQTLKLVKAESFEAFDTVYEGGYFPVMTERGISYTQETNILEQGIEDYKNGKIGDGKQPSSESEAWKGIVLSPHTHERNGTTEKLSLDISRFSQAVDDMIYDITMSEPIRDNMVILKNPRMREALVGLVGREKYNLLVHNTAELTHNSTSSDVRLHAAAESRVRQFIDNVDGAFGLSYIAGNASSFFMTTLIAPQVMMQIGAGNFAKYGSKNALKVLGSLTEGNLDFVKEAYALASEIDPNLQNFRQGIDDVRHSVFDKDNPKTRLVNAKWWDNLVQTKENAAELGLEGLMGGADMVVKVITTLTVYDMYMNGDGKGWDYDKVHKGKDKEQIAREAKSFTSHILYSTTMRSSMYDKAYLQKNTTGKLITRFWNEVRNGLNNIIGAHKDVHRDAKKMERAVKQGNYYEAHTHAIGAAGKTVNTFFAIIVAESIMNTIIYGLPFMTKEDEEEGKWGVEKTLLQHFNSAPQYAHEKITNPIETVSDYALALIPGVNAITYAASSAFGTGKITPRYGATVPIIKTMTDMAAAYNAPSMLYDSVTEEGLTWSEAISQLSAKEKGALMHSMAIPIGGMPGLNQAIKIMKKMEREGVELSDLDVINNSYIKNIDAYLKGKEESDLANVDGLSEEMKNVRDRLNPPAQGEALTQLGYDVLKYTESNNKWYATPGTSSAFGLYQFTESTWRNVMKLPGGENLTVKGRTSKSPSQQEQAMRILTNDNARILRKSEVPININTIYFAHHFGANKAKYVYGSQLKSDSIKLSNKLMTPGVLLANPALTKRKIRNVGDMKKYIKTQLKAGYEKLVDKEGKPPVRQLD